MTTKKKQWTKVFVAVVVTEELSFEEIANLLFVLRLNFRHWS